MSDHNCRVCGLYIDDLPCVEDGNCPTYEICPCYGVEFGNEDYKTEPTKRYREKWISEGANWFEPNEKPEKWEKKNSLKTFHENFYNSKSPDLPGFCLFIKGFFSLVVLYNIVNERTGAF